jgi:hypothetical protein
MTGESIVVMDDAGRIVWANQAAHDLAELPPAGLVGRSYLEFCPRETHAELLSLHARKLRGETVRFRIRVGPVPLEVTSGPVLVGEKRYLYAVGRRVRDSRQGDEPFLGMMAAAMADGREPGRFDLNACLLGAFRDEARRLRGRLRLEPGPTRSVRGHVWICRRVLRSLLLEAAAGRGRIEVRTGSDARWVWISLARPSGIRISPPIVRICRAMLRAKEGRLRLGRTELKFWMRPA